MTAKITRAEEDRLRHYGRLCATQVTDVAFVAIEDVGAAIPRLLDALDAARQMWTALQEEHYCATLRDDGITCDGCPTSRALAAFAALVDLEDK